MSNVGHHTIPIMDWAVALVPGSTAFESCPLGLHVLWNSSGDLVVVATGNLIESHIVQTRCQYCWLFVADGL
jgi:hypothetical protein